YCLPTEYAEGFPTTLLEAAACRCPIVTTRTAGTGELLPGDDYAVFLENADADTIRAGLETLLRDPAAAAARAENAYENLCAHFTWQAVFATMMEVISAKRS
ncbi:glycosyltransferase, partial [Gemmiger formicilis]|uniref:glycosyltransferase n=1 Tax=Gemmiger formicilis TaxID=745368 RepID=UPI003AB094A6